MLDAKSGEEERRLFAVQWHSSVATLCLWPAALPTAANTAGGFARRVGEPNRHAAEDLWAFGSHRKSLATPKPSSRWISTESIVALEPTSDATDLNRVG